MKILKCVSKKKVFYIYFVLALVLWDDIKPSIDWVNQQVPEAIRPFCLEKPNLDIDLDIDYESMK